MEWMFLAIIAGTILVIVRSLDVITIKFKDPEPPKLSKRIKGRKQLKG
jgi:hypothetical protein